MTHFFHNLQVLTWFHKIINTGSALISLPVFLRLTNNYDPYIRMFYDNINPNNHKVEITAASSSCQRNLKECAILAHPILVNEGPEILNAGLLNYSYLLIGI